MQRFLVESAGLPEGRPSLLARRSCSTASSLPRGRDLRRGLHELELQLAAPRQPTAGGPPGVGGFGCRRGGRDGAVGGARRAPRGCTRRTSPQGGGGEVIAKVTRRRRTGGRGRVRSVVLSWPARTNTRTLTSWRQPRPSASSGRVAPIGGRTEGPRRRPWRGPGALYGDRGAGGVCWHLALSTKGGADRDLSDEECVPAVGPAGCAPAWPPSTPVTAKQPAAGWRCVTGAPGPGTTTCTSIVNLVREDGKVASTRNDFQAPPQPSAPTSSAATELSAVEGQSQEEAAMHRDHPGRAREKAPPHRTGRS